jgi:hypothetical protein
MDRNAIDLTHHEERFRCKKENIKDDCYSHVNFLLKNMKDIYSSPIFNPNCETNTETPSMLPKDSRRVKESCWAL